MLTIANWEFETLDGMYCLVKKDGMLYPIITIEQVEQMLSENAGCDVLDFGSCSEIVLEEYAFIFDTLQESEQDEERKELLSEIMINIGINYEER